MTKYEPLRDGLETCLIGIVSGDRAETLTDYTAKRVNKQVSILPIGIIGAKNVAPARVASPLCQLGLGGAKHESIQRRIRRIENHGELTAALCCHPLVKERLVIATL